MEQQNTNQKKSKSTQVRGPQLKQQIIESEEYGEKKRSENQGSDIVDDKVRYPSAPVKKNFKKENS